MEAAPSAPRIPWRHAPALLALYAGAIAVLSWPWLATASTRVLNHWDPPFHAWKLMFAARTLLAGHILPPGGDTNLYYPNSGAFFYEALHWPQAVFAAPLLAAGANPVQTYHATLVFFWALSGVLFWAWLRALGLRRAGAVLGGLFFTVLPYRMSYLVEFNMQLAFGLPLLLLATTRFFQRPGFRYALLAAVAWWLQATSELYQAVFFLLAAPLLVLPLLARDPALLRSWRRFWCPLAAAAVLCAALSLPFLLPYARTLGDGTLSRSLEEMRQHTLEPFSYLLPWGRIHLLPTIRARPDEMSVYPTLALALASLWAFVAHRRTAGTTMRRWRDRSVARAVATGLGASALFGFVMSFGPDIAISSAGLKVPNGLFNLLHAVVPGLAGFRVVSRFAVFPVMAVCAAAAVGVDAATQALRDHSRALRATALALFLAAFLVECIPPEAIRTRPVRDMSRSAVLASLDTRTEPYVLAVVPIGNRSLDSEHMLTVERNDRLGLWAWGGTYPAWTSKAKESLSARHGGDPVAAARFLRQPWPETLVLEDKRPFPGIQPNDYAAWFGPLAETIAEDSDFRLLRILPASEDETEVVRRVRRDFALACPVARFTMSAHSAPARVWLDLNGVPVGFWDVAATPMECAVDVPPDLLVDHLPERFRFHAEGDRPFRLDGFRLDVGSAPHDCAAATPADPPDLPWLTTSQTLPEGAVPLDVHYPGGITLCGAIPRPGMSPPGTFPLRLFLRFPETARTAPDITLSPGFARNGSVLFQHPFHLRQTIDGNAFRFARGQIVASDIALPLPGLLQPGETYDLTLDVKNAAGHRINGRDADGRKVRHAPLGLQFAK